MSRRTIKAINWAALAERVPESEKAAYSAFKAKSDQFMQRMMANAEAPPAINWAYYKNNISNTSIVDKFQKEYESLSIPYPADKYTAEIDAEQQSKAKEIQEYKESIDATIKQLGEQKESIKNMLPFELMTMEDYCILFPDGTFSKDKVSLWPHTPDAQDSPEDELEASDDH